MAPTPGFVPARDSIFLGVLHRQGVDRPSKGVPGPPRQVGMAPPKDENGFYASMVTSDVPGPTRCER